MKKLMISVFIATVSFANFAFANTFICSQTATGACTYFVASSPAASPLVAQKGDVISSEAGFRVPTSDGWVPYTPGPSGTNPYTGTANTAAPASN